MFMIKPLFSISILNWNGKHLLKKCIESVLKQTYKPIEIILVDNGSTDGSIEFVKKYFEKKVKIVQFNKNIGYSKGHNMGFEKSRGKWVALMSNDVILDKNWVSAVMQTAQKEPDAGVIGSLGYFKNLSESVNGNYMDILGIVAPCNNKQVTSLMTVAGGVFAVNKKYFDKPYDEDYFIYGDEGFLGMRTLLKNKKNIVCLKTNYKFQGTGSEGTAKLKEKTVFLSERNNILNFLRFLNIKTIILLLPIIAIHYITSRILNLILTGKWNYFQWRINAWVWILTNITQILEKRRQSQSEKRTGDKKLFELFISISPNEIKHHNIMAKLFQKYLKLIYPLI